MERSSVLIDDDHRWREQKWEGMTVFRGSYAVRSIPGAGFTILWAVRVGRQAATGVWVVGGHVEGAI